MAMLAVCSAAAALALVADQSGGTAAAAEAAAVPQRFLSSFAYTISNTAPAHGQMWSSDDFVTRGPDGKERPWQNLILVTGNDTAFAQLSADVLRRTGHNLPMLWYWAGWRTDIVAPGSKPDNLTRFSNRYGELRAQFPHLPATPWGVYCGDEPDLARHPERQAMLAKGLQQVRRRYPRAVTYLNMLYASLGCPGENPGGPFLCNASTWHGDPTALAIALGKMELDWMSTDEYYDVSIQHYQDVYRERLYPHLRPEQRIVLLPFAAYCEIGCQPNVTIAGVLLSCSS
jgi:hypothetical protein